MAPQNQFNPPPPGPWVIDRKIPVSVILMLVAQTVAFAWWASALDFQVKNDSRRIEQLESSDMARGRDLSFLNERLARIEEQQKAQLDILKRLDERRR